MSKGALAKGSKRRGKSSCSAETTFACRTGEGTSGWTIPSSDDPPASSLPKDFCACNEPHHFTNTGLQQEKGTPTYQLTSKFQPRNRPKLSYPHHTQLAGAFFLSQKPRARIHQASRLPCSCVLHLRLHAKFGTVLFRNTTTAAKRNARRRHQISSQTQPCCDPTFTFTTRRYKLLWTLEIPSSLICVVPGGLSWIIIKGRTFTTGSPSQPAQLPRGLHADTWDAPPYRSL
jgi:hypothetical protein